MATTKKILPTNRGIDAKVYINDVEIGGQQNAQLNRTVNVIDITNQITGEWEKSIAGTRSWALLCTGMNIKGAPAYELLKTAFDNGTEVDIKITDEDIEYSGRAIISSFPIVANYNNSYTYNIAFRGIGELN